MSAFEDFSYKLQAIHLIELLIRNDEVMKRRRVGFKVLNCQSVLSYQFRHSGKS